jgi:hypothetical protein
MAWTGFALREVLVFDRVLGSERLRVVINFSSTESPVTPVVGGVVFPVSKSAGSNVLEPPEVLVIAVS